MLGAVWKEKVGKELVGKLSQKKGRDWFGLAINVVRAWLG